MKTLPNTVAILGGGVEAADIVLRFVLKLKGHEAPVIILDYTGRGAVILGAHNKMSIERFPVCWCNIADRRRPVALFQLRASDHFRQVFKRALCDIQRIARVELNETTLDWATEAAYDLSRSGTVGLGALLKSLSQPETRRWFLETQKDPADLGSLLKMLKWALTYPAVYGFSEGGNASGLDEALSRKGVIWIEAPMELFENCEHAITACLIDAAMEHAVKTALDNDRIGNRQRGMMTVVHLFPQTKMASAIPEWVGETSHAVKHVGVHRLYHNRQLSRLQDSWARDVSAVWVVGKISNLGRDAHSSWLKTEEIEQISGLGAGKVWIRQNDTGKSVTAKVKESANEIGLAHQLRIESAMRMKIVSVRQMSSALAEIDIAHGAERDLYFRLCDNEVLRLGWLKVQTGRKNSHGVDGVTIAMFKENLDEELTLLAGELERGAYRCKPLRRLQIPKSDGGKRDIGIAAVRDRVVQIACLSLLEPLFEPTFSRFSFAFRPRRSAHHALALARSMIASGRTWIVIADIKKCFDSIDHEVLINMLSRRIGDRDMLNLIRHWLEIEVLDFDELLPMIVGVPQGESLSPLLANIYLDPLDKHLEQLGLAFVRYADDIVILTKTEEEATHALEIMKTFLMATLRLELKPTKTSYVPLSECFDFLGFTIDADGMRIKKERLDDVQHLVGGYIKILGEPASTFGQRTDALMKINSVIRGWRNYFAFPDERAIADQLRLADGTLEQMAQYYLPAAIRNDPAWICRERFTRAAEPEENESEQETLERSDKTTGAYPEMPMHVEPQKWMVKGETLPAPKSLKKKKGSDEPLSEDDQTDMVSLRDGIVEHNNRLYVLTHGVYLTAADNEIVIRKRKEELYRQSMKNLCLVFLQGYGITISVDLQLKLADADIPVVLAPSVGELMAIMNSTLTSRSYLRSQQVLRRDDADIISAGLKLISSKMGNQAAVLRYFSKYRRKTAPEVGAQLTKTAESIRSLSAEVVTLDPAAKSVRALAMGLEGHAASLYWRQLMDIVPDGLGFSRRITKGAKDPVNQCLNYVYGMLYGEVWRAVMKAGLDPYFGLMHGSKRDQGSLVFDIIEEFRAPFADRLIIGMLGRGFQPEIGTHGFLKTRSRKQLALCFSKNWSKKILWRSRRMEPTAILAQQARSIAKLFNREGEYHPYKMRW